jgi:hypothetical protein
MGSTGRNLAVLALVAGAVASNPDEQSFARYLESRLQTEGGSHWLESKLLAYVASHSMQRQNYYVLSVIRVPSDVLSLANNGGSDRLTYVGMFGQWFRWPWSTNGISTAINPSDNAK